nr:hypothetical protein [Tanacetum cinerariifolium]
VPPQVSKVARDAFSPLDVDSNHDIHERKVKKDKDYVELKKKCNKALQDLDKNPLASDMRSKIKTLRGQVNSLHNEYIRLVLKENKWVNYEQTMSTLHARVKDLESKREKLKLLSKKPLSLRLNLSSSHSKPLTSKLCVCEGRLYGCYFDYPGGICLLPLSAINTALMLSFEVARICLDSFFVIRCPKNIPSSTLKEHFLGLSFKLIARSLSKNTPSLVKRLSFLHLFPPSGFGDILCSILKGSPLTIIVFETPVRWAVVHAKTLALAFRRSCNFILVFVVLPSKALLLKAKSSPSRIQQGESLNTMDFSAYHEDWGFDWCCAFFSFLTFAQLVSDTDLCHVRSLHENGNIWSCLVTICFWATMEVRENPVIRSPIGREPVHAFLSFVVVPRGDGRKVPQERGYHSEPGEGVVAANMEVVIGGNSLVLTFCMGIGVEKRGGGVIYLSFVMLQK